MVKMPYWPVPYGHKEIDLGLNRIKSLLSNLGNPQWNLPPVIHVAGTNGKGSTIAYLRTILEAAGYLVHAYTSPHLIRFNERLYLAGQEISDAELYFYSEQCRLASTEGELTFFEGTTAMAFLAFASVKADVLLLEVGMGGRLDATNVIDKPALSIITPISYDHTEYLGETLAHIAQEKAGIIKNQSPCIISWQQKEALAVLIESCREKKAPYFCYDLDWQVQTQEDCFDLILHHPFIKQVLSQEQEQQVKHRPDLSSAYDRQEIIQTSAQEPRLNPIQDISYRRRLSLPRPSLLGLHQFVNASTAIFSALYLAQTGIFPKIRLAHINHAMINTFWPARLQPITQGILYEMLPPGAELWLDGAHNIGGAEMLAASITNMKPAKLLYLIHGRTKNRDIAGYLQYFKDFTQMICCVTVQNEPRAEKAEIIHETARDLGFHSLVCSSLHEAIKSCLDHFHKLILQSNNNNYDMRILICGSLYLAGDVLEANNV